MRLAWGPISAEWRRFCLILQENEPERLSRLFAFQIGLPLAERRETVHPGAMREGALGARDVLGLAGPGLLRGRLQRAAIREGELPGERAEPVHGIEVRGRLLVGLSAG